MNNDDAEQSLVNILRSGENCGMGVFAPSCRVVTARHCINVALERADRIVRVSKFMDPSVFVDMVVEWYDETFELDIAVLKPLSAETFHEFEKHLRPAPLQFSLPEPHQFFDVRLFRRDEGWASGRSQLIEEGQQQLIEEGQQKLIEEGQQMVEIESDPVIVVHQGTSGTPVFDNAGSVIGVAMLSGADAQSYDGVTTREGKEPNPLFASLWPVPPEVKRFFANVNEVKENKQGDTHATQSDKMDD
jgi:hypothetical protein